MVNIVLLAFLKTFHSLKNPEKNIHHVFTTMLTPLTQFSIIYETMAATENTYFPTI